MYYIIAFILKIILWSLAFIYYTILQLYHIIFLFKIWKIGFITFYKGQFNFNKKGWPHDPSEHW